MEDKLIKEQPVLISSLKNPFNPLPLAVTAAAIQQKAALNKIMEDLEKPFTNPSTICHGRVQEKDFELMVQPQWWKTVFADAMYLKTDGDVIEDPLITEEEIK